MVTGFAILLALFASAADAALPASVLEALERSPYVYVATSRKNGGFGDPSEIWFLAHQGAVYVASPTNTWRVRRIRAGRPKAKIWVGKRDGPSFLATGEIVGDEAVTKRLFETYARKYPDGWSKWEERFRTQLRDGSRVVIRYRPLGAPSATGADAKP